MARVRTGPGSGTPPVDRPKAGAASRPATPTAAPSVARQGATSDFEPGTPRTRGPEAQGTVVQQAILRLRDTVERLVQRHDVSDRQRGWSQIPAHARDLVLEVAEWAGGDRLGRLAGSVLEAYAKDRGVAHSLLGATAAAAQQGAVAPPERGATSAPRPSPSDAERALQTLTSVEEPTPSKLAQSVTFATDLASEHFPDLASSAAALKSADALLRSPDALAERAIVKGLIRELSDWCRANRGTKGLPDEQRQKCDALLHHTRRLFEMTEVEFRDARTDAGFPGLQLLPSETSPLGRLVPSSAGEAMEGQLRAVVFSPHNLVSRRIGGAFKPETGELLLPMEAVQELRAEGKTAHELQHLRTADAERRGEIRLTHGEVRSLSENDLSTYRPDYPGYRTFFSFDELLAHGISVGYSGNALRRAMKSGDVEAVEEHTRDLAKGLDVLETLSGRTSELLGRALEDLASRPEHASFEARPNAAGGYTGYLLMYVKGGTELTVPLMGRTATEHAERLAGSDVIMLPAEVLAEARQQLGALSEASQRLNEALQPLRAQLPREGPRPAGDALETLIRSALEATGIVRKASRAFARELGDTSPDQERRDPVLDAR